MTANTRPTDKKRRSAGRLLLIIVWTTVKILIIPVLCVAALILGLALGYSVLGKHPWIEAFDWNTWKHMYDLVFANR